MDFNTLLSHLLSNTSDDIALTINGASKKIVGMSRYATKNIPDGEYIKIVFADHSLLLLLIADQEIYYADAAIGKIEGTTDEMIGNVKEINYNNKVFEIANKHDYQYVIQKYRGGLEDIEGECNFSDYSPADGSKSMLSLAVISYTQERADVYCEQIPLTNISL